MLARKGARQLALGAAVFLVLIMTAPVAAAPPNTMKVAKVTGTYEYTVFGNLRAASISAHATDPVKGTWTWTHTLGTWSGPVTCLRVSGDDAWLAGPTWDGANAAFMWVHDGGIPGRTGDTAFTWGADPGETLEDMEALCESMTTSPYGFDAFDVVSGNLNVWDAS